MFHQVLSICLKLNEQFFQKGEESLLISNFCELLAIDRQRDGLLVSTISWFSKVIYAWYSTFLSAVSTVFNLRIHTFKLSVQFHNLLSMLPLIIHRLQVCFTSNWAGVHHTNCLKNKRAELIAEWTVVRRGRDCQVLTLLPEVITQKY